MRVKKIIGLLISTSILGGVLVGCGGQQSASKSAQETEEPKQLDKLTVQSLWVPQAQFAGLYVADAKGFYEEEGIDVEILPGGDVSSEEQVENDIAQVGVAFYSSVLTYQEGGYDFINVFQTFRSSPQYLVAKAETGIKTGADLKGKKSRKLVWRQTV